MKRKCEICEQSGEIYLPINPKFREDARKYGYAKTMPETLNEKDYVCRYCQASDRERLCGVFVNKILGKRNYKLNVLDIAPSTAIAKFFLEKYSFCNYKTADLFMEGVDYQVDIQDMKTIKDEQFDFVICFHVLEHVKDDKKALKELYRIISQNGFGLFLVPIDLLQKEIDEEWGCSKEENIRRFGQEDHVRKYSKSGFVERMQEAGFKVFSLDTKWFGLKNTWNNAFTKTTTLYVVAKNPEYKISNLKEYFQNCFEKHVVREYKKGNIRYSIDGTEINQGYLSVWGWMFKEGKDNAFTTGIICLKKDNVICYRAKFKFKYRSDVEQIFGKQYGMSGIEVMIPISQLQKGTYEVSLLFDDTESVYDTEWMQLIEI